MADGLLTGKRLLVTGVLTEASIAFRIAALAQEQGAEVVLTGAGRSLGLTERISQRLPQPAPVVPLDVTDDAQLAELATRVASHVAGLDGVVHAIGFAPAPLLGGDFAAAAWADVAVALRVSAWSLAALAQAARPLLDRGAQVVGLDFDASRAWPAYDWMGVAKAALEATTRYLARDLGRDGVQVNLIAAGPLRTMAARSIPGFDDLAGVWEQRAPLGWDLCDPEPVARTAVALLAGWLPATTGSIVHADGGVHAVGA
jgi:enoyl ACP reductase